MDKKLRIVVLDGYSLNPGDLSWDALSKLGDLTVYDRVTMDPKDEALILERIGDAEVVYTNKTPLTREILKKLPKLKFIGVLATGFNVVDIEAAKEMGIPVSNVPVYGSAAVAQTAIALLLEMCHHVGEHNRSVQAGDWIRCPDYSYWNSPLIELEGMTMGIIGLGRIGRGTAKIAQAMGMKVLAYDGYEDKSLVSETLKYVGLDELLAESDVIALHCPQTPETTGIINRDSIAKMKDGVMIINNSRGPLIVEKDLVEALKSGKVGGAALDVIEVEPMPKDSILLGVDNLIITPHLSWAPRASRARLMQTAVDNLKAFMDGKPQHVVNP